MLWPDHRARLLQALIDHDAFASLRHDVAWKIIDWTFDLPRPPRVLRQCAALAVEQVDVSALAYTWLASTRDEAAARSREPRPSYLHMSGAVALQDVHLQQKTPPEGSGGLVPATPALDSAPPRAALTAGPTRPAIAAQTDTSAKPRHSPRRVRAHTRRLPARPRTARRRPSTSAVRKGRRAATPSAPRLAITAAAAAAAAVAIAIAVITLFLGALQPAIGNFQQRLAAEPTNLRTASAPLVVFFDPNSAILEPGAKAVLQPIAQQAQSQQLAVWITGYASPDGGTSAYNVALSLHRAHVVRDWLIALGVPAGQITHVQGADAPGPYPNAWCKEKKPDEATCPELRRAVIVLVSAMENP